MGTFLSHVEFDDFRTFGKFQVDLAPAPGLTLLVGTNGLGKSTFFDGIEWALSGRIRRFADYVGRHPEADYLTRRDAERPNSHSVSLAFDDGASFTRTGTSVPNEAELLATLKANGWSEIRDLGAYLALTHFLGQAAQQRFTSRPKNDQWEALKGPSGIDRLEIVRTALRGAATTAAFRRRLAQETAEVEIAEQELTRWRDDSGRLAELRAAARASGAPSASAISAGLAALEVACAAVGATVPTSDGVTEPTARVIAAREALEKSRTENASDQRELERLRAIVDAYEALAPACDPGGTAAAAAASTVGDATAALSQASLASSAAERSVEAAADIVAQAAAATKRIDALLMMLDDIADLQATIERLTQQRETLDRQTEEAAAVRLASATALETARRRQIARSSLAERRDADKRAVELAGRVASLTEDADNAEDRAARTAAAAAAASPTVASLEAERRRLRAQLAGLEAELATARRRASELADALATVAKHIDEHDEQCPVCSSGFPPGVLATLAAAAAGGQDADLAAKAQRVETTRRELDAAEAGLAAASEAATNAATSRTLADNASVTLVTARAELAGLLDSAPDADLATLARDRLSRTVAQITVFDQDAVLVPSTLAELEAATGNAGRAHDAVVAEAGRVGAEAAAARRRVVELEDALPGEMNGVARVALAAQSERDRELLRDAEGRLVDARATLAATLAAEATARQRLDAATAARAHMDQTIADAVADRRELAREWTATGVEGEPSRRGVTVRADRLGSEAASIAASLAEADLLARGLRDAADEKELAMLEERMAETSGADAPVDAALHEARLLERLSEARTARRTTTETQRAVNAYTEELKKRADRFSAEFLEPLNGLIDDFNRTLLSTPGETVQFSADAAVNRTDLGMRLRYADEVDNSRYDTRLAPQLVLSEGQLAANGFSILCAASVAYRWSTWRALLLDDPLQHNDIIHAAAFADVMRNLVEYEGYQLLMSSHDRAEGEFLFRKFDAAGLPCTMVTLTAPSRDGVLSEPPRHNAAAARLLAQPMAAAG